MNKRDRSPSENPPHVKDNGCFSSGDANESLEREREREREL